MEKIKVIRDAVGKTLTIWLSDPQAEAICEETAEEVVLMKDKQGKVIGVEFLHYEESKDETDISVETVIRKAG